jgi:hypothetical protein
MVESKQPVEPTPQEVKEIKEAVKAEEGDVNLKKEFEAFMSELKQLSKDDNKFT